MGRTKDVESKQAWQRTAAWLPINNGRKTAVGGEVISIASRCSSAATTERSGRETGMRVDGEDIDL